MAYIIGIGLKSMHRTYMFRSAALGLFFVTLAACGGTTVSDADRLIALDERGDEIFDTFIRDQDILAASALPEDGSASYTGVLVASGGVGTLGTASEERLVAFYGELGIDLNFASGALTGEADDFVSVSNFNESDDDDFVPITDGEISGSLAITGERAASVNAIYDISLTGRLDREDGGFLEYNRVGGVVGVYGDDADAVRVFGSTAVTFDGEEGFIGYGGVAAR